MQQLCKKGGCKGGSIFSVLSAAGNFVLKHVGDIATIGAIVVCVTTVGGGCAFATAVAAGARILQRSEEGISIKSSSNVIDVGVTLVSGGLLGLPARLGEGAVADSRVLTYVLRVHKALPDIVGWFAGLATSGRAP